MPLVDIAAANAVTTIPADVTEAWRVEASYPVDRRVRRIPVLTPGSIADIESQIGGYRDDGGNAVVAIRPDAKGMAFPLVPWAVTPIPEYCAREEMALMVILDRNDPFPWADLVAFARTYPRLAVIAIGAPLEGPAASKALDATANLVLDSSGSGAGARAANLAATHGAYRFAYGSGSAPVRSADVVVGLSEDDATMVRAGTARHLADGTWSSTFL